jgi:cytochrome c
MHASFRLYIGIFFFGVLLMNRTHFHASLAAAAFGAAIVIPLSAQAGDASAGKTVFRSQCGICHSPSEGKNVVGPSLFGVVGRHTASVTGFRYSQGNQSANLNWDEATLDKYLDSPKTIVPGTAMNFSGLKDPEKRSDVIAYLASLK